MRYLYCGNCERKSGYKRSYGWGTFFMVLLTCGFWFFIMPFYPPRCMTCGNDHYIPDRILPPGPDDPATYANLFKQFRRK
jgi:hypothetical protein